MQRLPPQDRAIRARFAELEAPIPPPPELKVWTLWAYQMWSGARVFVETGTYMGDTAAALAQVCQRVYSIELAPALAARARAKFAGRPAVQIFEGDSATVLPRILAELREPALFWLDAHYSGGPTAVSSEAAVPIFRELAAIFEHPVEGHIVLIDDIRHFCGQKGYPTFDELRAFVQARKPDWVFDVALDSARLHAPREAAAQPGTAAPPWARWVTPA
ncbi:MAG: hypothetical protein WD749_10060 [Phycisphaerales bacterium]